MRWDNPLGTFVAVGEGREVPVTPQNHFGSAFTDTVRSDCTVASTR